jgi:glycerophosphoryl diester phosphodiesterase
MPSSPSRQAELAALAALPFAHRGLHGHGRVENSRSAFEAALAGGYGIELDVQRSRDGTALVFHDYDLDRLTGETGALAARDAADLVGIPLTGSSDRIEPLASILQLIAGRAPLLIEVKSRGHVYKDLCASVAESLTGYPGPVGVMSFDPRIGHWFADQAPARLRGLVVTEEGKPWRGRAQRRLALWRAQPHFLAYDVRDLPSRFAAARRAKGMPVFTWTCRQIPDRERATLHADQIIFEEV